MKLIDMMLPKKSKEELQKENIPMDIGKQDKWPYGLQLRFETEQIEKIPLLKDYKVGDRVIIMAEASVIEVRMSETQATGDNKVQHIVALQVEQIACEPKVKKVPEKMNPKEYRSMREDK